MHQMDVDLHFATLEVQGARFEEWCTRVRRTIDNVLDQVGVKCDGIVDWQSVKLQLGGGLRSGGRSFDTMTVARYLTTEQAESRQGRRRRPRLVITTATPRSPMHGLEIAPHRALSRSCIRRPQTEVLTNPCPQYAH